MPPTLTRTLCRGQFAKDQQHGFGLQWRNSGQMYIGQWSNNRENGLGVHFKMHSLPSLYNPRAGQALFVGTFKNGCPLSGLLIECEDYKALTPNDFTPKFSLPAGQNKGAEEGAEEPGWEEKRADYWSGLLGQKIRNYEVEYDGGSAFWQSPVPLKQSGLFDMRGKLCEHEPAKCSGKLTDKRSLEAWWFSRTLVPNPDEAAKKKKAKAPKSPNGDDEDEEDAADRPPPPPPEPEKLKTFEHFLFLGTCVRNAKGLFPCPLSGIQKMLPATEPGGSGAADGGKMPPDLFEFEVAYTGKVWIGDNPSPEGQTSAKKYLIPASGENVL